MPRIKKIGTWRTKLLLLLLAFSVIPPLLLSWWHFVALRDSWQGSTLESLQALARARSEAVDQFTQDRRSEVERIASLMAPHVTAVELERARRGEPEVEDLPALQDGGSSVVEPVSPPPAEEAAPDPAGDGPGRAPSAALAELRQNLGLVLWDQRRFEELMIIDPEGRVVVSTHEGHEGHSAANRTYFQQGLGATYLEPVFVSPITGRLTMVVSTPVRDPSRGVVGVLAARLNLGWFFRLVNDTTGLGRSGETVVVKAEEDRLSFMAPTRHDQEAALQRTVAQSSSQGRPLAEATQGDGGTGEHVDYRGVEVLSAWEPIPSLEWGLEVKIDRSEAMRPVRQAALRMVTLLLLVIGAGVVAAFVVSAALVQPLKDLRRATERISRGDFEVELDDIQSEDEVGELARSFERMVAAIRFFRAHSRPLDEDDDEEPDEGPT